jgi:hypothetical protein
MVQMQREEAAQARQKEAERQGRINTGLERIKGIFHGAPVMQNVTRHGTAAAPGQGVASGAAVSGLPGYTYVQVPQAATSTAPRAQSSGYVGGQGATQPGQTGSGRLPQYSASSSSGGGYQYGGGVSTGGGGGGGMKWMVKGPDGQLHEVGSDVTYGGQEATGQTSGGIGPDFYNKFSQGLLDYYMPQVSEKYGEASDETKFRHARAGTLESSSKIRNLADLAKQNTIQEGLVRSNVDTATGDLKNRVAKEETAATGQLYATENPEVAASQAEHALTNISAEADNPAKTALGDIFNLATIGGTNYLQGVQNAKKIAATRAAASDASRIV